MLPAKQTALAMGMYHCMCACPLSLHEQSVTN